MKNTTLRMAGAAAWAFLALTAAVSARAEILLSEGWSRATPPGSKVASGYLTITNTGDAERKLLVITSPVSDSVMLHQSSMDAQGVMKMWPLAFLTLNAKQSIRLEPNGKHVMFRDIKAPFVAGQKVPLTLLFEDEKPVTVLLEVRPLVPDSPAAASKH